MDRRAFLTTLGVGLAAPTTRLPAAALPTVGLHLGLPFADLAIDTGGVLTRVAGLGVHQVELPPHGGRPLDPVAVRGILDRAGLSAPSRHVRMPDLFSNWKLLLRECQLLGSRVVVCAEVPAEQRASIDGYVRVAGLLNATATIVESVGMQLAVHPHIDDFRPRQGTVPLEVLMARTDPGLVTLQLDLSVLARAGRDPIDEIARFGGRTASLHINNVAAADGGPADLEAGRLDLPAVLSAAVAAGIRQYFVDDERLTGAWEHAKANVAYLSQLDV